MISTPFLWIFLPLIIAAILMLLRNQKLIALIAGLFSLFLTLTAWFLPYDSALTIGNLSFKVTSTFEILGRHLIISSTDKSLLVLIYGSAIIWFSIVPAIKTSPHLIPLGLAITALLTAALAVEPFLYAALLIEMAALLSIPVLSSLEQRKMKGVIRFVIFQTLAMPFILFSGWLLAGIDANPGNLDLVRQAAILIGLGFSFLLAVFPFHSWIPLVTEESSPFSVGFILWIFPTVALFFGLGFFDHYAWLRDDPSLKNILTTGGIIMVFGGGILASFQQHLGRIMGYAIIMETGFSFLTISLGSKVGLDGFFMLFIPRFLCLIIWVFALSIIKEQYPTLNLSDMKGLGRIWPFSATGVVLAALSFAGMPLLAGFPPHQAVWELLASKSLLIVFWVLIGNLGLFFSAIRIMSTFVGGFEGSVWEARETSMQRILLATGYLAILLLGLFPQLALPLWTKLPPVFIHLGQ
jgi:NADH-quinone oxidoreductase subunit N